MDKKKAAAEMVGSKSRSRDNWEIKESSCKYESNRRRSSGRCNYYEKRSRDYEESSGRNRDRDRERDRDRDRDRYEESSGLYRYRYRYRERRGDDDSLISKRKKLGEEGVARRTRAHELFGKRRPQWTFKGHNKYDLLHLLTAGTRRTDKHYLIYNDGTQVNVERLLGKYVLLYFLSLSLPNVRPNVSVIDDTFVGHVKETYEIYNPIGEFEVVFIALGDDASVFQDLFLSMPWLAIPHEDRTAREFLEKEYSIPHLYCERAIYFTPDGTLDYTCGTALFRCFGSQYFPFTHKRIEDMSRECHALQDEIFLKKEKPCLTTLVAILGKEIISRDGQKVPTSELKDKTLGLFFMEPTDAGFDQAKTLLEVWESLKNEHRDFEIVLVNKAPYSLYDVKAQFQKKFGRTIPWYALAVCGRKLGYIFEKGYMSGTDFAGDLIVLEPDKYEAFSYFAFKILEKFGPRAYPFTMGRAVELAKLEQQRKLVLGDFFPPQTLLVRGGSAIYKEETTISALSGKRVLLLFAEPSCFKSGSFFPELKQMYEKKRVDDNFEIIFFSLDREGTSQSSFRSSIQGMPWLVHAFEPRFTRSLTQKLYAHPLYLPAIAAFGADGHLETKESDLACKTDWSNEYPFIKADMDDEVHLDLVNQQQWGFEHLDNSERDEFD